MLNNNFDLGSCCACGQDKPSNNIVLLAWKSPYGFGWGCLACGLDTTGAMTVVCDECSNNQAELQWFVKGQPSFKDRAPVSDLTEPYDHDMTRHPEIWAPEDDYGNDDDDPVVLWEPGVGGITDSQLTRIVNQMGEI